MNIIKVVFTPKKRAPINCKRVEYLVADSELGKAAKKAIKAFRQEVDERLQGYYQKPDEFTQRVL